ncbi:MAG: LamG-like jellyroll fold domain-containing protein [Candidatus Parvarchaeum sp.]
MALAIPVLQSSPTLAPTLIAPAANSVLDLTQPVTFTFQYNIPPNSSFVPMTYYVLQIADSTNKSFNAPQFWDAATNSFSTAIVYNPAPTAQTTVFSVTVNFPSSGMNGYTYQWCVATYNTSTPGSQQTLYSSSWVFSGATTPNVSVVVNNANGLPGAPNDATPIVSWVTTYPGATVNYYQTQYAIWVYQGVVSASEIGLTTPLWTSGTVGSSTASSFPLSSIPLFLSSDVEYTIGVVITSNAGLQGTGVVNFSPYYTPLNLPTITVTASTDPNTGYPVNELTIQGYDNYLSLGSAAAPGEVVEGWVAGNANTTLSPANPSVVYPSLSASSGFGPYDPGSLGTITGWWRCLEPSTETVLTDSGPNGYTLSQIGSPTYKIDYPSAPYGIVDPILAQPGTSLYLSPKNAGGFTSTAVIIPTTTGTLAGWVYIPSDILNAPNNPTYFGWKNYLQFFFSIEAPNVGVMYAWVGNTAHKIAGTIKYNAWNHVAISCSSTTTTVYINGVASTSSFPLLPTSSTGVPGFGIGANITSTPSADYAATSTAISEVIVYSTALTAAQIEALYNNIQPLMAYTSYGSTGSLNPIIGGQTYNCLVSAGAATTAGNYLTVYVNWYTNNNIFISSSSTLTSVLTVTGSSPLVPLVLSDLIAPENASYFSIILVISSGQSPTYNVDMFGSVGLFLAPQTTWGPGGVVPFTQAIIYRSDGTFVRGASVTNPLTLYLGQNATILDYEIVPTISYTYTAQIIMNTTYLSGISDIVSPITPATEPITLEATEWWEIDPTNPASAINAQPTQWNPQNSEQLTPHMVTGSPVYNMVANVVMQQDFIATMELFSQSIYTAFQALLNSQKVLFIQSPWGPADSGYFRIGPEPGGMTSGNGTTNKNTTLLPSNTAGAHRTVAITASAQLRPADVAPVLPGGPTLVPVITAVSPSAAPAGTTIVLSGANFGPTQLSTSYVSLVNNGTTWGIPETPPSLNILSWSAATITFEFPVAADGYSLTVGTYASITVTTPNGTSAPVKVMVTS